MSLRRQLYPHHIPVHKVIFHLLVFGFVVETALVFLSGYILSHIRL